MPTPVSIVNFNPPLALEKQKNLFNLLEKMQRTLVCFSGGIDSTYALWSAKEVLGRPNVLAVTAVSPSLSQEDRRQVAVIAAQMEAAHQWIETKEMDNPKYVENSGSRCFYCKDELYSHASALAQKYEMTIIDGSNFSDLSDDRPGYSAAKEWKVRHPLEEAKLTKEEIRGLARHAGLPNWDRPASPCLSSRIPKGQAVTVEALKKVEAAEGYMKNLGFSVMRVRHLSDSTAKIEVGPKELYHAVAQGAKIRTHFSSLGFVNVYLDLMPKN